MLLGYFGLDSGLLCECLFVGSSVWNSNWVDFYVGSDSRILNFNLNSYDFSVVVMEFVCYR